jgi:hypothetical protein
MKVNDAVVLAGASGGLGRAVSEALPQAQEFSPGCRDKPIESRSSAAVVFTP